MEGPPVRALLWLPVCGLFASLYLPPGPDDLASLLGFAGRALLAAGAALVLTALAARWPALRPTRLALPGAALVLVVAVLTALLEAST